MAPATRVARTRNLISAPFTLKTLSRMRPRSNSVNAARMCSCSLSAGVVASTPSPSDTNAMPSAWSSSKSVTRWRTFRPRRSRRKQDEHIELPALRVGDEPVELRAPILRARDADVDIFRRGPLARLRVTAQLQQLVVDGLLCRVHAGVDGGSHDDSGSRRDL